MNRDIESRICVIGLGYVGLPLAVAFGEKFNTIGFDIDAVRISDLQKGFDKTKEVNKDELRGSRLLKLTSSEADLAAANVYIVTVPTPVDEYNVPDLSPLEIASSLIGKFLKAGDIVVYESTVFPGATEEICVPILEKNSGLKFNIDFGCGYSPERINPGDKNRKLKDITKIVSGSSDMVLEILSEIYGSIITAGIYKAQSIKVAEAAKVIENTQRDINIALINELEMIFSKMNLSTRHILAAAKTKWNFLDFSPGLVGGHCIGVDPYYLTYKAQAVGHNPKLILAGRKVNDGMASYVAQKYVKDMLKKKIPLSGAKVLVMGVTFKENCPDLRNSKVFDLIDELNEFGVSVDVWDPLVDSDHIKSRNFLVIHEPATQTYDGIVIAVGHEEFKKLGANFILERCKKNHLILDLKYAFNEDDFVSN